MQDVKTEKLYTWIQARRMALTSNDSHRNGPEPSIFLGGGAE